MATLVNQEISYESAQIPVAFAALTGDSTRKIYTAASKPWSGAIITTGVEPYVVAAYGLITGGEVTPGAAVGNVAVALATVMMPGATGSPGPDATTGIGTANPNATLEVPLNSSAAGTPYRIDSITVNGTLGIELVDGIVGEAFTESRGVAGGPPSIPLASIEIGQVRRNYFHAGTNRAVTAAEIFAVPGTHQERYDFPVWQTDPIRGQVTFADALPLIHGATKSEPPTAAKLIYARYATPLYAPIPRVRDFVPGETSNSTSSEAYYDNVTIGSVSSSLGQASFTASLGDGVTDVLLGKVGQNLLFRFKPDKNRAPYIVTQGVLGVTRTFGVGAAASGDFTISPSQASVNVAV